jgi:hypothetical protein
MIFIEQNNQKEIMTVLVFDKNFMGNQVAMTFIELR